MKIEVITKITNLVDKFFLKEVLVLLKEADEKEKASFSLSRNYETVEEQYGDVLQKLAE